MNKSILQLSELKNLAVYYILFLIAINLSNLSPRFNLIEVSSLQRIQILFKDESFFLIFKILINFITQSKIKAHIFFNLKGYYIPWIQWWHTQLKREGTCSKFIGKYIWILDFRFPVNADYGDFYFYSWNVRNCCWGAFTWSWFEI